MKPKLARTLVLVAVALYVIAIAIRLVGHGSLERRDALGAIVLAVVGWQAFRRPQS